MTASLQIKNDTVYVVLGWAQGSQRKQKWVKTDLPLKYRKKAGEEIRSKVLAEWKAKITPDYQEITFGSFLKDWLERKKSSIETTTYNEYSRMITNIIAPYFDGKGIQLQECGIKEIEAFYRYKMEKDGVSANTISHYQASIYSAFKDGVRLGIVANNPAERVLLPKVKKFQGGYYTPDEAQKLLSVSTGTKLEIPIYLALWFGLRRGEIAGMRWSDINFTEKTMSVSGVIVKSNGTKGRFEYRANPKSSAGVRTFPLTDEHIRVMRRWKAQQGANRLACGSEYNKIWSGFLCVDEGGNLISPEYISCNFRTLLERHNLRKVRFHDLRHTNAVLLLSNGASMQEVQKWLGHESYTTTDESYSGILAETKRHTATILSGILTSQESLA